jgi:hypothetical protein
MLWHVPDFPPDSPHQCYAVLRTPSTNNKRSRSGSSGALSIPSRLGYSQKGQSLVVIPLLPREALSFAHLDPGGILGEGSSGIVVRGACRGVEAALKVFHCRHPLPAARREAAAYQVCPLVKILLAQLPTTSLQKCLVLACTSLSVAIFEQYIRDSNEPMALSLFMLLGRAAKTISYFSARTQCDRACMKNVLPA